MHSQEDLIDTSPEACVKRQRTSAGRFHGALYLSVNGKITSDSNNKLYFISQKVIIGIKIFNAIGIKIFNNLIFHIVNILVEDTQVIFFIK